MIELDPYERWKQLGRPGGGFEAWQASQGGGAAPQVTGGSVAAPMPTPGAVPTANSPDAAYLAEVRAAGQGKSEDYARFSDAELLSWRKYYQGGGKFRNDYGDIVDKPDERGPNTPGNRNGTGDQGDFGRGWGTSGLDSETQNPLQSVLATLQGTPASVKAPWMPVDPASGAGGIYGGYTGGQGTVPGKVGVTESTPNPAGPYGGYTGGQNLPVPPLPTGPVQSSLTSLIAPLQSGFAAPTQPQSGLTNMLAGRQKRPGQWF